MKFDPEKLFTKQKRIGRGSFGDIYKGFVCLYAIQFLWPQQLSAVHNIYLFSVDKQTNQTVAIKVIDLEKVTDEIEDTTVLSQCCCPQVIKYFGTYSKVHLVESGQEAVLE